MDKLLTTSPVRFLSRARGPQAILIITTLDTAQIGESLCLPNPPLFR